MAAAEPPCNFPWPVAQQQPLGFVVYQLHQLLHLPSLRELTMIAIGEREHTRILPGEILNPLTPFAASVSTDRRRQTLAISLSLFTSVCVLV